MGIGQTKLKDQNAVILFVEYRASIMTAHNHYSELSFAEINEAGVDEEETRICYNVELLWRGTPKKGVDWHIGMWIGYEDPSTSTPLYRLLAHYEFNMAAE